MSKRSTTEAGLSDDANPMKASNIEQETKVEEDVPMMDRRDSQLDEPSSYEKWILLVRRMLMFMLDKYKSRKSDHKRWDLVRQQMCPLVELDRNIANLMEHDFDVAGPGMAMSIEELLRNNSATAVNGGNNGVNGAISSATGLPALQQQDIKPQPLRPVFEPVSNQGMPFFFPALSRVPTIPSLAVNGGGGVGVRANAFPSPSTVPSSESPLPPPPAPTFVSPTVADSTRKGLDQALIKMERAESSESVASVASSAMSECNDIKDPTLKVIFNQKDEKPYHCSKCEYQAVRKADVTKHLATHTSIRKYPCRIAGTNCTKRFKDSSTRTRHEKTHYKKLFECQHCPAKFLREKNFDQHMQSRHNPARNQAPVNIDIDALLHDDDQNFATKIVQPEVMSTIMQDANFQTLAPSVFNSVNGLPIDVYQDGSHTLLQPERSNSDLLAPPLRSISQPDAPPLPLG